MESYSSGGKMEEWKLIDGTEYYFISNLGRVMSKKYGKPKVLKASKCKKYYSVNLKVNGVYHGCTIHRLVANAFLEPCEGKNYVNHKDENKHNNKVENLEWVTAKENARYGTVQKRISKKLTNNRYSSKAVIMFSEEGRTHFYPSISECARAYGVSPACVSKAIHKNKKFRGYNIKFKPTDNT